MLDKLDNTLRFQQQALNLLTKRQNILASNVANADTPGYLAKDIDFSTELKKVVSNNVSAPGAIQLSLTSGRHLAGRNTAKQSVELLYRVPDQPSMDGNTVDMDRERMNFVDNNMKYQSSLAFLGSQIKGMSTLLSQG